jgi:ubiquinone/menaquinone biosynthesis C-methylase UbiE
VLCFYNRCSCQRCFCSLYAPLRTSLTHFLHNIWCLQDELVAMMSKEGFVFCNYVNFTFGVVAVHSGFKI